jgi:hypothetical protein
MAPQWVIRKSNERAQVVVYSILGLSVVITLLALIDMLTFAQATAVR